MGACYVGRAAEWILRREVGSCGSWCGGGGRCYLYAQSPSQPQPARHLTVV